MWGLFGGVNLRLLSCEYEQKIHRRIHPKIQGPLNGGVGGLKGLSLFSETSRIRFRRVRFQTPNSVSFCAISELWAENSVSSSQPIICVPKLTHRVCCRTHRVLSSATVLNTLETAFRALYISRFGLVRPDFSIFLIFLAFPESSFSSVKPWG